jgi:hypothetical protein
MAALPKPKILTIRMKDEDGATGLVIEHGDVEIEKTIPATHGLVRISAIFTDDGKLNDVEIITSKT